MSTNHVAHISDDIRLKHITLFFMHSRVTHILEEGVLTWLTFILEWEIKSSETKKKT